MNRFIKRVGCCYSVWVLALFIPALPATGKESGDAAQSGTALSLTDIDSLLSRSRQAMAQGDYAQADSLLQRAEAAKPKYPVLHFGDTPARVRRDLEKLLGGRPNASSNSTNSASATPKGNQVANPFANSAQTEAEELPASNSRYNDEVSVSTFTAADSDTANQGTDREQSSRLLLAARQALVVGDSVQATKHLQKARSFNVEYAESEDSPTRLAQSLAELQQLEASKDNSASWKHSYAKFLVSQGNAIIRMGRPGEF